MRSTDQLKRVEKYRWHLTDSLTHSLSISWPQVRTFVRLWTVVQLPNAYIYRLSAEKSGHHDGPHSFLRSEVVRAEDAQGPEEQTLRFQAGGVPLRQDAMMGSPERQPPEKAQRCDGKSSLAETSREGLIDSSGKSNLVQAGGDSLQPIAGSSLSIPGTLPSALAPMGQPGSSTTIEVRQQVRKIEFARQSRPAPTSALNQVSHS